MKAIDKHKIPNLKYEGWYWLSDKTAPVVLDAGMFPVDKLDEGERFIIEAQFWNEDEKINISIRYADGKHYITQYNLKEIPAERKSPLRTLLGHRLKEKDLKVVDLWQEVELETGNKETQKTMTTLAPLCSVFVGFHEKENN